MKKRSLRQAALENAIWLMLPFFAVAMWAAQKAATSSAQLSFFQLIASVGSFAFLALVLRMTRSARVYPQAREQAYLAKSKLTKPTSKSQAHRQNETVVSRSGASASFDAHLPNFISQQSGR